MILVMAWLILGAAPNIHAQVCDSNFSDGGKSITANVTVDSGGSPVTHDAVVTVGTRLRLDALAMAHGRCDLWYEDWTGGQYRGCTIHDIFERTVNHIDMWADITTATTLNGRYMTGYVSGMAPDGTTRDYSVLGTLSPSAIK